jgi:hypothetical protein
MSAGKPDPTGLGLGIVKRILDLHGSRITVQSSPKQGTRFEFELPSQKSAWEPQIIRSPEFLLGSWCACRLSSAVHPKSTKFI